MTDVRSQIIFSRNFLSDTEDLFQDLLNNVDWDESIRSRKTACYGEPYDYSETSYDFEPMLPVMNRISEQLVDVVGFRPNNCLLNYYEDGNSRLGWHGDTVTMLEPNTGIAIVCLGDARIFQLRRNAAQTEIYNYVLTSGSLLCMPGSIQEDWKHCIPKVVSEESRISMTFRKMIPRDQLTGTRN